MMRLWKTSYARPASSGNAGIVSVLAHAVIIAAWVVGTLPSSSLPSDGSSNRIYYIPPPERPATLRGDARSRFATSRSRRASGFGPGPTDIDARRPIAAPSARPRPAETANRFDGAAATASSATRATDSVFTVLEVDSAVVRSQSSAAPAYPRDLIAKHVEGSVLARYIVDTTGFADTTSFEVLQATDPAFIRAVRDALPYMRFSPAKIGVLKVKQLVEQAVHLSHHAPRRAEPSRASCHEQGSRNT